MWIKSISERFYVMKTDGIEVSVIRLVPCTICGMKHRVLQNALLPISLQSSDAMPKCKELRLRRQDYYKCNKQRVLDKKKVWYQKKRSVLLLQDAAKRLRSGRTRNPHARTIKKLREACVEFDSNNRIVCVKTATSDPTVAIDDIKASNP